MEEVAAFLRIGANTAYDWVARGDLPKVPNRGSCVRIPAKAFNRIHDGDAG